jgi:hypothetical protein
MSGVLQPTGTHSIGALFIFLDLLKGQSEGFTQLFLTHT